MAPGLLSGQARFSTASCKSSMSPEAMAAGQWLGCLPTLTVPASQRARACLVNLGKI